MSPQQKSSLGSQPARVRVNQGKQSKHAKIYSNVQMSTRFNVDRHFFFKRHLAPKRYQVCSITFFYPKRYRIAQMERQGCRFGSSDGAGRFLLSLQDLNSLTEDENLDLASSDNGNDENSEHEIEQEEDNLLGYWQNIGRGHQVVVPRDMAEPIQQMSRNNRSHDRELVPFKTTGHKRKAEELLYEKRQYEKAKWACVKQNESSYEQSTCLGFMKLMKYICQQNSAGLFLGMTLPVVTIVHTNQTRTELQPEVTIAYYLPAQFQNETPQPFDAEIAIEEWPAHTIYTSDLNWLMTK
ncbi:heme-binding protein soul3 isoform X3 [Chiloscyllium punctatum]|uniref:heme-binding protein soul3 isoform X3 n=1 Tax=Chiloscyllium punctatum TaxID=137246 RepID=UPI003B634899